MGIVDGEHLIMHFKVASQYKGLITLYTIHWIFKIYVGIKNARKKARKTRENSPAREEFSILHYAFDKKKAS